MNKYVTGDIIKKLREECKLTQVQLAEKLNVSDKAVSKWETGRGYPDITLLEPLAESLGVSVTELITGESISNTNKSFNMARMKFYVCPVCGNVITSSGEAVISCCGLTLPALEAEEADDEHIMNLEKSEDEYYITFDHEMSKSHYISFVAGVKDDGYELKKLYPEGPAEARFKTSRTKYLYLYCNKHGLYKCHIRKMIKR